MGIFHEVCDTYDKENADAKAEDIISGITGKRPIGDRAPDGYDVRISIWQLWLDRGGIFILSNWRDNDGPFLSYTFNGRNSSHRRTA